MLYFLKNNYFFQKHNILIYICKKSNKIMLKKIKFTLLIVFSTISTYAQVGIGTTTPLGSLDVTSTSDGILIPRVALTNTTTATVSTPTKSELVYNTATSGDVTPGYYYWETTPTVASDRWVRLSTAAGNDWAVTGNAGTNPATNFAGTTDAQDFAIRTTNTERARITSAGSMGIGTNAPNGALDINSSTQGMVPPRVALTSTAIEAPVVNPAGGALVAGTLVWNTNTNSPTIATAVAPGMYYWNGTRWISLAGSPGGLDWSIIGNGGIDGGTSTTGGAHFIGTYDNTNMDIRTNGVHRARVSNLGEFFIGAYNTVLPGDLMNGVSIGNATFPWAVNGYTDQNGAGTYGLVQGGSTGFAGVQGEYEGSNSAGPGVRGLSNSTGTGTNLNDSNSGVNGQLGTTTDFAFSVKGQTTGNAARAVGGVLGINNTNASYGMLGYERSNGTNCAVLGNAAYVNNTFRNSAQQINSSIGLGIQGGFLGGHLKGSQFGLITKGELVGQYTDGSSISNKGYAVVNTTSNGEKVATYVPTSTSIDISTKGTGKLVNGTAKIFFDKNYSNLTDKNKPVIVTVSPMGETKGVYVSEVTNDGFIVKENNNGNSNVSFYWIAIGEKNNTESMSIPSELLTRDFDANLDSFLTIDEEAKETSKAMWWNGSNLEFGKIAPKEAHEGSNIPELVKRPKEKKKQ